MNTRNRPAPERRVGRESAYPATPDPAEPRAGGSAGVRARRPQGKRKSRCLASGTPSRVRAGSTGRALPRFGQPLAREGIRRGVAGRRLVHPPHPRSPVVLPVRASGRRNGAARVGPRRRRVFGRFARKRERERETAAPPPRRQTPGGCPIRTERERETRTRLLRPQVGREDPLDLSISLSGGKETNQDSPSSGERSGKSPAPNPRAPPRARGNCGVRKSGPAAAAAPRSF